MMANRSRAALTEKDLRDCEHDARRWGQFKRAVFFQQMADLWGKMPERQWCVLAWERASQLTEELYEGGLCPVHETKLDRYLDGDVCDECEGWVYDCSAHEAAEELCSRFGEMGFGDYWLEIRFSEFDREFINGSDVAKEDLVLDCAEYGCSHVAKRLADDRVYFLSKIRAWLVQLCEEWMNSAPPSHSMVVHNLRDAVKE